MLTRKFILNTGLSRFIVRPPVLIIYTISNVFFPSVWRTGQSMSLCSRCYGEGVSNLKHLIIELVNKICCYSCWIHPESKFTQNHKLISSFKMQILKSAVPTLWFLDLISRMFLVNKHFRNHSLLFSFSFYVHRLLVPFYYYIGIIQGCPMKY